MEKLRFQGYSDDTFDWGRDDHDDCAEGSLRVVQVTALGEGLTVVGQCILANGCWFIGIAPLAEDRPLPNWPMRWTLADNGYSPVLEIEAPDGVGITRLESIE